MTPASSAKRTVVFAALLVTSGCGSGASSAPPAAVTAEPTRAPAAAAQNAQPPPAGDGALPTPAPGTYEVHEWGLMRQRAGDVLDVGAVPPVVRAEPMVVDKPILYFHAGGQVRIERIDVVASGDVLEHWPLVASGRPREISWRGLALDAGRRVGTPSCVLGAYPTASQPPCAGLGDQCESSRLGPLLARGAACLDTSHGQHAFLFYRSRTTAFTPPLRLERLASGDVRATNTGDLPIPGSLVVIRRRNGGTTARSIVAPAAHQSVSLSQPAPSDGTTADMPVMPSDTGNGRRAIVDTMRALGLADAEIEAFLVAWEPALFGRGVAANDRLTLDELSTDRRGVVDLPPADSVLYFLPTSTCDRVSRLSFAPAPRAVRRALAVWGGLP